MKLTIFLPMLHPEDVLLLNDGGTPEKTGSAPEGAHNVNIRLRQGIWKNLTLVFWENPVTHYHSRGRLYSSHVDKNSGVFLKNDFRKGVCQSTPGDYC